ncbi:MAG TPA: NAD(P)H-dependent oxidoreductase [Chloroflexota bacterium]
MTDRLAIGIAGSLFAPSRSGALVSAVLTALDRQAVPTRLVDLAQLPADGLLARRKVAEVDDALAAVGSASILVLGTPIYRAAYSGQLKAFFDLLPQAALSGKVAGLIATGAVAHHALAIDHALRPLVASLGGLAAAQSIYATDETYPSASEPLPEPLATAVADLAAELLRLS